MRVSSFKIHWLCVLSELGAKARAFGLLRLPARLRPLGFRAAASPKPAAGFRLFVD
jgi:hypothetical protein